MTRAPSVHWHGENPYIRICAGGLADYFASHCFRESVICLALQISCVMAPIGQYTHQERGLNRIMVTNPSTVEVSITL